MFFVGLGLSELKVSGHRQTSALQARHHVEKVSLIAMAVLFETDSSTRHDSNL